MGKKYRYGYIGLVIAELAVLIWILSGYAKERTVIDIPYTDFIGTTIPDDRGGWYVDASFPLEDSGIFDYTPDTVLKKGTYDITIRYETDTNKNFCTVSASTKGFWGLRADIIHMSPKTKELTCTVYLGEDVEDFQVLSFFGREGYMMIKGCTITETRAALRIRFVTFLFLFAAADLLLAAWKKGLLSKISNKALCKAALLAAIVFAVSYPMFSGYIMDAIDIEYHLMRIDGIAEGLLSGQFPVKVQPNWIYGYGYPASVFYGDLFLYFPAILRLIGFSITFAYSALMIVCNTVTTLVSYWCFKRIAQDERIGMLAAFLYTSAPYRMTNLYISGDVGAVWGMAFLPLLAYGIYAVFSNEKQEKYERLWIPMVIGFTGVIQSHILSCLLYSFFVILACLVYIGKVFGRGRGRTFVVLAKTVLYSALLNAGFLLPCLTSMGSYKIGHAGNEIVRIQTFGAHVSQLFSLFYPGVGDGHPAAMGTYHEMACGIGLALGTGLFLYCMALFYGREREKKIKGAAFPIFTLLALWMASLYFPWDWLAENVKILRMVIANIEFSIRFLTAATVLATVTLVLALRYFKEHANIKILYVVVLMLGMIGCFYMLDNRIYLVNGPRLMDTTSLGKSDYFCTIFSYPGTNLELLTSEKIGSGENTEILSYEKEYLTVHMEVENLSDYEDWVEVPLLYNDWYRCQIEGNGSGGERTEVLPGDNNVVRVKIPAGYCGKVKIYFKEPVSWRIAEWISVCTFLAMAGAEVIRRKPWLRSKTESYS